MPDREDGPLFQDWHAGYRWIMGKLGGLDQAGYVRANPFSEVQVVRMAVEEISSSSDREVLLRALVAMGWTADRLAKVGVHLDNTAG